jgi:hypothetical protein
MRRSPKDRGSLLATSRRARLMLGAAALLAVAGGVHAQPISMDYCVQPIGGGMYEYTFTLKLDNLTGTWAPGMGWGWVIFGDARRVPPLTNVAMNPSQWPVGPWTSLSSSGGGHNGPTLAPVLNRWIPTAVGESLTWTATSTAFIDEPGLTFSTLSHEGGAQAANWKVINRLDCGVQLGACCRPDGTCIVVSEAGCLIEGGVYSGNGTNCGTANCAQPPTGACCRASGCAIVTAAICSATGGSYIGDNTTCATAGCNPPPASALTPPDFVAPSRVWAYNTAHTQVLSGGFRASGFRLTGLADRGIEAFQSDLLMELVPPSGPSLLIGGDGGTPLMPGSIRWAALRTVGTGPAANGNPATLDSTFSWDFGQINGEWTVNFWNNWNTTGEVKWNNVMIEMLELATGACCMPDATCVDTARGNCTTQGGIFRGDNTLCGGAGCTNYLATNIAPRFGASTVGFGQFLDLTATQALQVTQIDYAPNVAVNQPTLLEVWTTNGSYVGNDLNPSVWVLHDTLVGTSSGGGVVVPRELNVPLPIAAGQTVGVYLIAQQGGLRNELSPPNTFADANLTLYSLVQRDVPWGGTSTARVFGGRIHYNFGGSPACYANCDGSTVEPILNVDDFTCFINEYASAQSLPHAQQLAHYSNCDGSTIAPVLNVDDFTCFINQYAQGCP